MLDIEKLTREVLYNCDISDASHAGLYSICGLALRLRDLYKWENRLPPWEEKDTGEILEWIGAKEELWEDVVELDFCKLSVNGDRYDVFDVDRINKALEPHGLYYGAGYAYSLKPTFLLAQIEEKSIINDISVITLGHELARDLLTLPALTQGDTVLMRTEAARLYLWDQMSYIKKSGRPALQYALANCGLPGNNTCELRPHLEQLLEIQKDSFIYHEIGEMTDTVFERTIWREIIAEHPRSPVELAARVLKDLLADTNAAGTLPRIIERRNKPALAFYAAFLDGLAREFFPELRVAFQLFTESEDWSLIEQTVADGRNRATELTNRIIDFHHTGMKKENGKEWVTEQVEKHILDKVQNRSVE